MEEPNKKGKRLTGTIISDKMDESAVVEVKRFVKHPKYGKYISKRKRYTVHNPDNKHATGEKVTIVETRPISKRKHFVIA